MEKADRSICRVSEKRRVRWIDFWYETKGFLKGKAHVTVFGMK